MCRNFITFFSQVWLEKKYLLQPYPLFLVMFTHSPTATVCCSRYFAARKTVFYDVEETGRQGGCPWLLLHQLYRFGCYHNSAQNVFHICFKRCATGSGQHMFSISPDFSIKIPGPPVPFSSSHDQKWIYVGATWCCTEGLEKIKVRDAISLRAYPSNP
jgi:hypothetical protein